MKHETKYYLVEESVMPEAIMKVLEAKMLLDQGKVRFISEAVEKVGISRSVFYKYHQSVRPFFDNEVHTTMTLSLELIDDPGVLTRVLSILAKYELNVLTINQTIPINHIANVTVTFETVTAKMSVSVLVDELEEDENVRKVIVLARE